MMETGLTLAAAASAGPSSIDTVTSSDHEPNFDFSSYASVRAGADKVLKLVETQVDLAVSTYRQELVQCRKELQEYGSFKCRFEEVHADLRRKEEECSELKRELELDRGHITEMEETLSRLTDSHEDLKKHSQSQEAENAALKEQIQELKAHLEMLSGFHASAPVPYPDHGYSSSDNKNFFFPSSRSDVTSTFRDTDESVASELTSMQLDVPDDPLDASVHQQPSMEEDTMSMHPGISDSGDANIFINPAVLRGSSSTSPPPPPSSPPHNAAPASTLSPSSSPVHHAPRSSPPPSSTPAPASPPANPTTISSDPTPSPSDEKPTVRKLRSELAKLRSERTKLEKAYSAAMKKINSTHLQSGHTLRIADDSRLKFYKKQLMEAQAALNQKEDLLDTVCECSGLDVDENGSLRFSEKGNEVFEEIWQATELNHMQDDIEIELTPKEILPSLKTRVQRLRARLDEARRELQHQ